MSEQETNGLDQDAVTSRHEMRNQFQRLEASINLGFVNVTNELRMSREQGHIPVSILKVIIRAITWPFALVIIWITGLKLLAPHLFG